MLLKQTITTFCLLITASVVLNGVHAKDVFASQALVNAVQRAEDQVAKIVADFHPHVDKQVNKMTHDMPQLDGRSLRMRDYKRLQFSGFRHWLDAWRDQFALLLS